MNHNTAVAVILSAFCISIAGGMTISSFAPDSKALQIQACMSQPGMQYVREWGSHYVCIPVEKEQ
jgi:hypothetical protein